MGPGWDLVGSSAFTGKDEVRSLVGELRSHVPHSVAVAAKKKKFPNSAPALFSPHTLYPNC